MLLTKNPASPRGFWYNRSTMNVLLLDADGVLIKPSRYFSQVYADTHGLDHKKLDEFFRGDFRLALTGEADLKDLIRRRHDAWQYKGDPDELLRQWFSAENVVDKTLMDKVQNLRLQGVKVYLATDQEAYRTEYVKDVMFPGLLDGMFVSCEIGVRKIDPRFFEVIVKQLGDQIPGLAPDDVWFFDDNPANVESARQAGIRAALYQEPDDLEMVR